MTVLDLNLPDSLPNITAPIHVTTLIFSKPSESEAVQTSSTRSAYCDPTRIWVSLHLGDDIVGLESSLSLYLVRPFLDLTLGSDSPFQPYIPGV